MTTPQKKGGGGWVIAGLVGTALVLLFLLWPRKKTTVKPPPAKAGGGPANMKAVDPGDGKDAAGVQRQPGNIDQAPISVTPAAVNEEDPDPGLTKSSGRARLIYDPLDSDDEFVEII